MKSFINIFSGEVKETKEKIFWQERKKETTKESSVKIAEGKIIFLCSEHPNREGNI